MVCIFEYYIFFITLLVIDIVDIIEIKNLKCNNVIILYIKTKIQTLMITIIFQAAVSPKDTFALHSIILNVCEWSLTSLF